MSKKTKLYIAAGAATLLLMAIAVKATHKKTTVVEEAAREPLAAQTEEKAEAENAAALNSHETPITELEEVRKTLRSTWFTTDYTPDGANAFTLTFFEEKLFLDYHGQENSAIPPQISYRYEIVDASHLTLYNAQTGDAVVENAEFSLARQEDKYLLVCHAFPCSSGEFYMGTVSIEEDGTPVTHYVTSFSEDSSYFSERNLAATAQAETAIVGDWKGTYMEWPTEEDYWYFSFDEKGGYSFRQGDRQEEGTYTIAVNEADENYTSLLSLTCADGTHNYAFWMSADGTRLTMKDTANSDAIPVFSRQ